MILCANLNAHANNPQRYWAHAPEEVRATLVPALTPFYEGKPQLIRDEAIRSSAFAGMTLMLAAKGMSYDSCPMIGFDADAVAKLVRLPEDHILSFMLAIGKQSKPVWPRGERLPESEVVIEDLFPEKRN